MTMSESCRRTDLQMEASVSAPSLRMLSDKERLQLRQVNTDFIECLAEKLDRTKARSRTCLHHGREEVILDRLPWDL